MRKSFYEIHELEREAALAAKFVANGEPTEIRYRETTRLLVVFTDTDGEHKTWVVL